MCTHRWRMTCYGQHVRSQGARCLTRRHSTSPDLVKASERGKKTTESCFAPETARNRPFGLRTMFDTVYWTCVERSVCGE